VKYAHLVYVSLFFAVTLIGMDTNDIYGPDEPRNEDDNQQELISISIEHKVYPIHIYEQFSQHKRYKPFCGTNEQYKHFEKYKQLEYQNEAKYTKLLKGVLDIEKIRKLNQEQKEEKMRLQKLYANARFGRFVIHTAVRTYTAHIPLTTFYYEVSPSSSPEASYAILHGIESRPINRNNNQPMHGYESKS